MNQRKFLIVVDMQNDFIDGSLGTREAQAIVPAAAARIRECREAGWAVIHKDHRAGVVVGLLWRGLTSYARDLGLRYIFGTCSLHGTDPEKYANCTSYLRQHYVSEKYDIHAVRDPFEYGTIKDLPMGRAEFPGLMKAYLKIGAVVSRNGFIDRDFNCCDVMIVLDRLNMNERYTKRFLGF